jgi:hypothetical protein
MACKPQKKAAPKLSVLKMDMDDAQNDIDYLKSTYIISSQVRLVTNMYCVTGKEESRNKAHVFAHKQNHPMIPKPKGQHGRKKGGYNLQDELGLSENKAKYDALQVRQPFTNKLLSLIIYVF